MYFVYHTDQKCLFCMIFLCNIGPELHVHDDMDAVTVLCC